MKYERLTERRGQYIALKGKDLHMDEEYTILKNRLAELEDKIENGTLVEFPCKVGDTVYCIYHNGECDYWIEEELVHDFILTNDGEIDIGTECRMIGKFNRYDVFLTEEIAKQKLKELEE